MKLNVYYGFNPVYFQHFFFSRGRYGRFYGVTDQSKCAFTVTGGPFWTAAPLNRL